MRKKKNKRMQSKINSFFEVRNESLSQLPSPSQKESGMSEEPIQSPSGSGSSFPEGNWSEEPIPEGDWGEMKKKEFFFQRSRGRSPTKRR